MTIYLWEIPENYSENQIGRYERERSPDRFLFEKGIQLDENHISTTPIWINLNPSRYDFNCWI